MEYYNEKNFERIISNAFNMQCDAKELEAISLQLDIPELERLYRICEMIEECARDTRVLIGKALDEREDAEMEEEEE